MSLDETEPRYVISIAAKILGTQTHTLRYYEKMGIIEPSRSRGNIRLYSERDIARIKQMKSLTEDGVAKIEAGITTPDEVLKNTQFVTTV